jgi:hypothetical protein
LRHRADYETRADHRQPAEAALARALLRELRTVETRLATAQWPNELRDGINDLEALPGEVQALSRKVPLQQQQDMYHWRLHVSPLLNEAVARLDRMEATANR